MITVASDVRLMPVPPECIDDLPDGTIAKLKQSMRHGMSALTLMEMYYLLRTGRLVLLFLLFNGIAKAFIVVEHIQYPSTMRVRVIGMGGFAPFDEWFEHSVRKMLEYARAVGAEAVEGVVRPGIAEALSRLGYDARQRWVVLEVE
jgi:hypothetical protein